MALGLHSPHNVLVAGNLLPNEEEGGGHAPLGKAVQQRPRGGPAGAVVKGEGNEFGLLLLLYLRRAVYRQGYGHAAVRFQGQKWEKQGQRQKKGPIFSLFSHFLHPVSHRDMATSSMRRRRVLFSAKIFCPF